MFFEQNRNLGLLAEEIAAAFFSRKGYKLLERNYRTPCGEVDLIFQNRRGQIIFVEVKARATGRYGLPQEAVTARKQQHIIRTAMWFLQQKGWFDRQIRFDVLAVRFLKKNKPEIEHIPWAFDAQGGAL